MFEMPARVVVDLAVLSNEPRRHLGVRINLLVFEPLLLDLAGGCHSFANFQGAFAGRLGSQVGIFHGGYFNLDIDAIEQRPGDFRWTAGALRDVSPKKPQGRDSWPRPA